MYPIMPYSHIPGTVAAVGKSTSIGSTQVAPPARPEISAAMPTVHAAIFEEANVDEEEMGTVLRWVILPWVPDLCARLHWWHRVASELARWWQWWHCEWRAGGCGGLLS